MKIIPIKELDGIENNTPDYVIRQVNKRVEGLKGLPIEVRELIRCHNDFIIDVGPGEGISTMGISEVFKPQRIIGLEMDKKHLVAAWPECNKYPQMSLFWGALPGTPSNKRVDDNVAVPQYQGDKCSMMFSWTGISRHDLFEKSSNWHHLVESIGVFVVPKFWREGTKSLETEWDSVKELVTNAGGICSDWEEYHEIEGFSSMEVYPTNLTVSARGWILWLSGLFDELEISFWNTLTDRWKKDAKYQLEDIDLPLEIILLRK